MGKNLEVGSERVEGPVSHVFFAIGTSHFSSDVAEVVTQTLVLFTKIRASEAVKTAKIQIPLKSSQINIFDDFLFV